MSDEIFKYGCVYLKIKNIDKLSKIKNIIKEKDLDPNENLVSTYHVTILYGLDINVSTEQVKEKIKDIRIDEIIVTGMSLFENDNDVLKLDVFADYQMLEMRDRLKELPNEEKYPEYNPHITLAYLISGEGKKYIPNQNKFDDPIFFEIDDVIYSHGGKNQKDRIHESLKTNKSFLNERKP